MAPYNGVFAIFFFVIIDRGLFQTFPLELDILELAPWRLVDVSTESGIKEDILIFARGSNLATVYFTNQRIEKCFD